MSQQVSCQNGERRQSVEYEPARNLIVARVSGVLTNEVRSRVIDQAAAISLAHGCNRLFCDYRDAEYVESTLGIYTYGEEIALRGPIRRQFRIAVLYARDASDHQFWETVMVNRGFLARVFLREEEALTWLQAGP